MDCATQWTGVTSEQRMACQQDSTTPSLVVWTVELLHKRQLLANLTAKASTTLTVKLPESLHVQQKIQFEKFAAQLLPSTIQDKSTQLSYHRQHFSEGGRGFQPCVLTCGDTRGKWSRFADFLHKDNAVGVATTQGRTLEDSSVCLFLIPALLLYPYLDENSSGTTERLFGLFSWNIEEDNSECTEPEPEPDISDTTAEVKTVVTPVPNNPAIPAKRTSPDLSVQLADVKEKSLGDGVLGESSSLEIGSTESKATWAEENQEDHVIQVSKISTLDTSSVHSEPPEAEQSQDNGGFQTPPSIKLSISNSPSEPAGAENDLDDRYFETPKSSILAITSVASKPDGLETNLGNAGLLTTKSLSVVTSSMELKLATPQFQEAHSLDSVDDCMPSATYSGSIPEAVKCCTVTNTSNILADEIPVPALLPNTSYNDLSQQIYSEDSSHSLSGDAEHPYEMSNDPVKVASLHHSQKHHLPQEENSEACDQLGEDESMDKLPDLQPVVLKKSNHSNKYPYTSNKRQNHTSNTDNQLLKNNTDMDGQLLKTKPDQYKPHSKKIPTTSKTKLPSVNIHHQVQQRKRLKTQTLGVFHDHDFNDPFDYDLIQMSPHSQPTKCSQFTDDIDEPLAPPQPELPVVGMMPEVISKGNIEPVMEIIGRSRDPRLSGATQPVQSTHNTGSTALMGLTSNKAPKRKISYEDYVFKHPKPIQKEDIGQQTDAKITKDVGFMTVLKRATRNASVQVSDLSKRKDPVCELQHLAMKESVIGALGALTSSLRSGMTITTQITAILTLEKIMDIITRTARFDLVEKLREESEGSMVFLEGGDKIITPSLTKVSSKFPKHQPAVINKNREAKKRSKKIEQIPQCILLQHTPEKHTLEAEEILKQILFSSGNSDLTNVSVTQKSDVYNTKEYLSFDNRNPNPPSRAIAPPDKSQSDISPHKTKIHPEAIIDEPQNSKKRSDVKSVTLLKKMISQKRGSSQPEIYDEITPSLATALEWNTHTVEQDMNARQTDLQLKSGAILERSSGPPEICQERSAGQPKTYQEMSAGQLEIYRESSADYPAVSTKVSGAQFKPLVQSNTDQISFSPCEISDQIGTSVNEMIFPKDVFHSNYSNQNYTSHDTGTHQLKIPPHKGASPIGMSDVTQTSQLHPSHEEYICQLVEISPHRTNDQLILIPASSTSHFAGQKTTIPEEISDSPASPEPEPTLKVELHPTKIPVQVKIHDPSVISCRGKSVSATPLKVSHHEVKTVSKSCGSSYSSPCQNHIKAGRPSDLKQTYLAGNMGEQKVELDSQIIKLLKDPKKETIGYASMATCMQSEVKTDIKSEEKELPLRKRDEEITGNHVHFRDSIQEREVAAKPQRHVQIIYEAGDTNQKPIKVRQVKSDRRNDDMHYISSKQDVQKERMESTLVDNNKTILKQHSTADKKGMENSQEVLMETKFQQDVAMIDNDSNSESHLAKRIERVQQQVSNIPEQMKKVLSIDDVPVAKLRESRKRHVKIIYNQNNSPEKPRSLALEREEYNLCAKEKNHLEKPRPTSLEREENSLCSHTPKAAFEENPVGTDIRSDETLDEYGSDEMPEDIPRKRKWLPLANKRLGKRFKEMHSPDHDDQEFEDLQDIRKVIVQIKRPISAVVMNTNKEFPNRFTQGTEERTVMDTASNIKVTLRTNPVRGMTDTVDVINKSLHGTDVAERRFIVVGGELPFRESRLDIDPCKGVSGSFVSKQQNIIKVPPDKTKAPDSLQPECEVISSEDDFSVHCLPSNSTRKLDGMNKEGPTTKYDSNDTMIERNLKLFRMASDQNISRQMENFPTQNSRTITSTSQGKDPSNEQESQPVASVNSGAPYDAIFSASGYVTKRDLLNRALGVEHFVAGDFGADQVGNDKIEAKKSEEMRSRAGDSHIGIDRLEEERFGRDRSEGARLDERLEEASTKIDRSNENRTETTQLPQGYQHPLLQRELSPERPNMSPERLLKEPGVAWPYTVDHKNVPRTEPSLLELRLERFFNFVKTWRDGTSKTLQNLQNEAIQWHKRLSYTRRTFSLSFEKKLRTASFLFHWDGYSMTIGAANARLGELSIATSMAQYITVSCVFAETIKRIGRKREPKFRDELFDLQSNLDKVRFTMKNIYQKYVDVADVGERWVSTIPDMCSACIRKADTINIMLKEIQQEEMKKCRDGEQYGEAENDLLSQNSALKGILPSLLELQNSAISKSKTEPGELQALVPGILKHLQQLEGEIPDNLKEHLKKTIESFKDGQSQFQGIASESQNDRNCQPKVTQEQQQEHGSIGFWHKNLGMAESRMVRERTRQEWSGANFGEAAKRSRRMAEDKGYLIGYRRVPGTKYHVHSSEYFSYESSSTCSSEDRVHEKIIYDQGYESKASWNQQGDGHGDGDYQKNIDDQCFDPSSGTWKRCDGERTGDWVGQNTIAKVDDSLDSEPSPSIEDVPWRKSKLASKPSRESNSQKKSTGEAKSVEKSFTKKINQQTVYDNVCMGVAKGKEEAVLSEQTQVTKMKTKKSKCPVGKQASVTETRSKISFSIGSRKLLETNKNILPARKRPGLTFAIKEHSTIDSSTNISSQLYNADNNTVNMGNNKTSNALLDIGIKYANKGPTRNGKVSGTDSDSSVSDRDSRSESSSSDSSSIDRSHCQSGKNQSDEDTTSSDSDSDSPSMPKKYNRSIDVAGRKYVQIVGDQRRRRLAKAIPVPSALRQYVDNPHYRAAMCTMRLRCPRKLQCCYAHTPAETRKSFFRELKVHELEDHTLWIDAENVWRLHELHRTGTTPRT